MKIAIIPARGGSKRIPRKNIRLFLNKPIIEYSIKSALSSGCFDEVMVSTEDQEIAEIARSLGAQVPFFRTKKNSDDHSMLADVIEEVLLDYGKLGKTFEFLCCILATAPFVTSEKLIQGWNLLSESQSEGVVPVTKFSYPIQRALKCESRAEMFWPENYNCRSQDLTPAYHDTGQFYWLKTDSFLKQKKVFPTDMVPLIVSELESQDVDTEEDWQLAELKYQLLQTRHNETQSANYRSR